MPLFGGFAVTEVGLFPDIAGCSDGWFCMLDHFRGRVTCPYGQTQADIDTLPGDDPARCRVPNGQGNMTSIPVELPVDPQFVDRRLEDVVYCSCQCSGPDPTADYYCTCPSGFECASPSGSPPPAAGFCIKPGVSYDPTMPPQGVCEKSGTDLRTHCGNGRRNP